MLNNGSSVITISGEPGTGTTTIAKLLSEKLNIPLDYIGEEFRKLALEHNMTLEEFSEYSKHHPEIDLELDKRQLQSARFGPKILEGRLSGWLVKSNKIPSYSILLTADLETRINRIMGRENKTYEQVKAEILSREDCEMERYRKFYNVDYLDSEHYDLIIDTTHLAPEQIVRRIVEVLGKQNIKG